MIKINKTQLAKILKESVLAPNADKLISTMLSVGGERYLIGRAAELVHLSLNAPTKDQQTEQLKTAITLLGIARHAIGPQKQKFETVVTEKKKHGTEVSRYDKNGAV